MNALNNNVLRDILVQVNNLYGKGIFFWYSGSPHNLSIVKV